MEQDIQEQTINGSKSREPETQRPRRMESSESRRQRQEDRMDGWKKRGEKR